ncbi:MAG: tyrosine-type recombinase/integrase [Dorea sp.]|nr:tyrosine-type recombinase/integrase [Dorea sp.]
MFQKQIQYIRSAFKTRIRRADVKEIRVHDLRHSHASMLINLGANPVLVAERLGHESPTITMNTYAHLFPKAQLDIVQKIAKAKY